jgi:starch synthase (maltosyl-transferring)
VVCRRVRGDGPTSPISKGAPSRWGRRRTIRDVLASIAENYAKGTPNGIRMDADSALIWSPGHFTWMDTNHPAGTPREGYPVEIQSLWIRLLRQLEKKSAPDGRAKKMARPGRTRDRSFEKLFWLEDKAGSPMCCSPDRASSRATPRPATRCAATACFAVSLGLVTGERAKRCVEAAQKYLVVPGALRSLAPLPVSVPLPIYRDGGRLLEQSREPYWPRYEGDEDTRRKPAYHNGTAWTWTFPGFCEALARAWDFAGSRGGGQKRIWAARKNC